jgi:hypothetical protein
LRNCCRAFRRSGQTRGRVSRSWAAADLGPRRLRGFRARQRGEWRSEAGRGGDHWRTRGGRARGVAAYGCLAGQAAEWVAIRFSPEVRLYVRKGARNAMLCLWGKWSLDVSKRMRIQKLVRPQRYNGVKQETASGCPRGISRWNGQPGSMKR